MTDRKRTTTEEIETTLACSAFAEEGVPAYSVARRKKMPTPRRHRQPGGESILDLVEDDFACTAFSDQNEECPISDDKKK